MFFRMVNLPTESSEYLYTASLIIAAHVIPAKAGIQENTGFPRVKHGAGLVKPGMTDCTTFISSCLVGVQRVYPVRNNAPLLCSGHENYSFFSEHGVQSPV
jgi:hypothetical protein